MDNKKDKQPSLKEYLESIYSRQSKIHETMINPIAWAMWKSIESQVLYGVFTIDEYDFKKQPWFRELKPELRNFAQVIIAKTIFEIQRVELSFREEYAKKEAMEKIREGMTSLDEVMRKKT